MRYIRLYNKQPKPVKWKYFDPTRRITPESIRYSPLESSDQLPATFIRLTSTEPTVLAP